MKVRIKDMTEERFILIIDSIKKIQNTVEKLHYVFAEKFCVLCINRI